MKRNTTLGIYRITACATALLIAGVATEAFAGSKYTSSGQVVIRHFNDGSGSATGVLSMIYNDATVNQYIGCQASSSGIFCHARDELRANHASCSSTSSYLSQAVATMAPDARITFFWNPNGVCKSVTVRRSSELADKQD